MIVDDKRLLIAHFDVIDKFEKTLDILPGEEYLFIFRIIKLSN